jgi:hypothetical protein
LSIFIEINVPHFVSMLRHVSIKAEEQRVPHLLPPISMMVPENPKPRLMGFETLLEHFVCPTRQELPWVGRDHWDQLSGTIMGENDFRFLSFECLNDLISLFPIQLLIVPVGPSEDSPFPVNAEGTPDKEKLEFAVLEREGMKPEIAQEMRGEIVVVVVVARHNAMPHRVHDSHVLVIEAQIPYLDGVRDTADQIMVRATLTPVGEVAVAIAEGSDIGGVLHITIHSAYAENAIESIHVLTPNISFTNKKPTARLSPGQWALVD